MANPIIEYGEYRHVLTDHILTIGRAPDNDIVIKSPGVDDYHLQVQMNDRQVALNPLHSVYKGSQKITTCRTFDHNTRLSIGATHINLWLDIEQEMPNQQPNKWWHCLTHPLAAILWFVLAISLPLWVDFLNTIQRYVLNIRLLFYVASGLLILVWILQASLLPLAKRYLFFPILGILSFFSLSLDLCEQAAYWFNFQFNQGWFNYLALALSVGLFLAILRAFLRDYVFLAGKWLNAYTMMFASPCLLVVFYIFLQNNGFYEYRRYHYPSYHNGLLPEKTDFVQTKTIEELFSIDKTEQLSIIDK